MEDFSRHLADEISVWLESLRIETTQYTPVSPDNQYRPLPKSVTPLLLLQLVTTRYYLLHALLILVTQVSE